MQGGTSPSACECRARRYRRFRLSLAALALLVATTARAQGNLPDGLEDLVTSLRPARPAVSGGTAAPTARVDALRATWSERGTLRYLGAPPGMAFAAPGASAAEPGVTARRFLESQRSRFGLGNPALGLRVFRTRQSGERHFVRLQETLSGVPIFGAMASMQLDGEGGVEAVIADLSGIDATIDIRPGIPASQAAEQARIRVRGSDSTTTIDIRPPALHLWVPSVLGLAGEPRLVWAIDVGVPTGGSFRLLLDARDGTLVREYPLDYSALDRQIYDCNNTSTNFATFVRDEGDPPCGIADADAAYDQLASTYSFYLTHHARDGFDDAGGILRASVRYCPSPTCPWQNAVWDGFYGNIRFGEGWTVDDVTAHEFTHGVTEHESGLIYENASGAMNESFSDVWGEFVDLANPAGGFDDPALRWLIGEALPNFTLRSMEDPPAYQNPDRLGSPLYTPPAATPTLGNDYGGVHNNSGINNKLCYLLTDGGTFNGQTIYGKGVDAVADLYYEVNANLLVPAADWVDLFNALMQAAIYLGWSTADRENLRNACNAVEIDILVVDWTSSCPIQTGIPSCSGLVGPFQTVLAGHDGVAAGSSLEIRAGVYAENITLSKRLRLRAKGGAVRIGQ